MLDFIESDVKKGYQVEVFLHGPALDRSTMKVWSQAPWADHKSVTMTLCEAAWRRLGSESLDPPGLLASLIQFWDRVLRAKAVRCVGGGQWPADWPKPSASSCIEVAKGKKFGFVVNGQPSSDDQQSMIELVMAGAVLELDLRVAFSSKVDDGPSIEGLKAWSQLWDHGLASKIDHPDVDESFAERCWWVL